jgi:hypothetical protein
MSYYQKIEFNSNVVVEMRWPDFKSVLNSKGLVPQYLSDGATYTIFAVDGGITYTCMIVIDSSTYPFSDIAPDYSATQNDLDKTDFENNFKNVSNKPLIWRTPDGRERVTTEKSNSSTITFYSQDWTDKTTWYPSSVISENEVLTNPSSDNITFVTAYANIIDTYHGKITGEDFLKDAASKSYRVSVKVNGVAKTEQDPHLATGGHYTVDYTAGHIVFLSALTSGDVVTCTYHFASNSIFVIAPGAGKQIRLSVVELQFSKDVVINDSVYFQPYGFVESFAPQYCTTNGGPYPPGTKIPLGNPLVYKTIQDYLNDSKKAYPVYPGIGGSGWRGTTQDSITLDWEYEGEKILRSDQGMEIRVYLQHDAVFGGSFATATFYCRSENLT